MKTNLVEEDSLRKFYASEAAKTNTKREDLMVIRRELRDLRGTIESQQDQLNRWDKQTRYATIELAMQDRKGYVPPTDPGFSTTVGRTFSNSIHGLVAFGKGIVYAVVFLLPWLPIAVLLLLVLRLCLPRRKKSLPMRRQVEAVPLAEDVSGHEGKG
jgi:hypothetical protein